MLPLVHHTQNVLYRNNCFRKALNEQKEMKLLLDMYKGVSKDQRDKVQLMAVEKKLRIEMEDMRQQLKKMQVSKFAMLPNQFLVCRVKYRLFTGE